MLSPKETHLTDKTPKRLKVKEWEIKQAEIENKMD